MYTINENDGILQNPLATTKSRTHQDRAHPQQRTGNIFFFECNIHDDFCQFSLIKDEITDKNLIIICNLKKYLYMPKTII